MGLDQKFHQRETDEYPLDLKEEYGKLSEWIHDLTRLYKHRLFIKLIDVQSPLGIYKSLRHWIRKYPTFIKICQNTPQLCWGDEWPPLSPGGRGLGLRLGRAYGSER